MPDPAEKSDDLIAELAKMMGTPAEPAAPPAPAVAPPPVFTPPPPSASATPIRIPGMDAPRQGISSAGATITVAQEAPRAPVTGVIRIPGMSAPAPVAPSAPVGKLDFGRPIATGPASAEPLTSLADRIAARAAEIEAKPKAEPQPPAQAIRFPELRTVSENKSFATGPAIVPTPAPAPMPPPAPPAGPDFNFDFGFSSPAPSQGRAASPSGPALDPIAALINDLAQPTQSSAETRPAAPVIPVLRTTAPPAPPKPTPAPVPARPAANAPIPLRPVMPRAPEPDRFAMAPGAGLNMRPPTSQPLSSPLPRIPEPQAPPAEPDPMAEIENLIGEAVRVELNPGPVRVQAAQSPVAPRVAFEPEALVDEEIHSEPPPIVPPLSTQFAPRRSAIKDDGHAAAEDTILAAAAATGTPVEHFEPSMAEESPYRRLKVKPQRASSSLRQYVGMAVAGTLLLAAGLGLYWVLNMGRTASVDTAKAPQLTASTAAVKEIPKATDKPVTDVTKSPVMQQMEGVSQVPSAEQLVTTDQTAGAAAVDTPQVAATGDTDLSEGGLANRKVRTVTVRPDGTIVSGDDAVAGNEALPIDRPNVPSVPSTETTNLLGNDNSVATVGTDATQGGSGLIPLANIPDTPATDAAASQDVQPVMDPTIVPPRPISFPVHAASTATATAPRSQVNAVVSDQGVGGQINLLGADSLAPPKAAAAAPQQVAPVDTATAAPAAGGAPAYVQLASSMSEGDANAAVKAATARFGSVFEGNRLVVQQADLGTKGVRWRVRLPASSLADANGICAQIKALGGDCFATTSN